MKDKGSELTDWLYGYVGTVCDMIPKIQTSPRKVKLKEKCFWTLLCSFFFLTLQQTRLYGYNQNDNLRSYGPMDTLMGVEQGTLMQIGLQSSIYAGMFMMAWRWYETSATKKAINYTKKQQERLASMEVLLSVCITIFLALKDVIMGACGTLSELSSGIIVLLLVQLIAGSLITLTMDALLSKGYGIGSGITFFITVGTCSDLLMKMLSPMTINDGKGHQFVGVIIEMFRSFTKDNKISAFYNVFTRSHPYLPNLAGLFFTVLFVAVALGVHNMKVHLPLTSTRSKGMRTSYPIKLLYSGSTPVFMYAQMLFVVSSLETLFSILGKTLGFSFFANLFSKYDESHKLVGGLLYYLRSPGSFGLAIQDPIQLIVYAAVLITACALIAKTMLGNNASSSQQVAHQLKEQGMIIPGYRQQSTVKVLDRYIPTAAVVGGILVAVLSLSADLFGTMSSGTSLMMAVGAIMEYTKTIAEEQKDELGFSFFSAH